MEINNQKRVVTVLFFLFSCLTIFGQDKPWHFRGYLSPGVAISPVQHKRYENGETSLNEMSRKGRVGLWGAGVDLLKRVNDDLFIGTNASFITKGYLATYTKWFSGGYENGTGYSRDDLTYLETKIYLEKHFLISNSNKKFSIGAGFFYGARPLINWGGGPGPGFDLFGSDFGPNISGGILINRFYSKLEFEKGLLFVKNDEEARFKTGMISLQIGYYFF